MWPYLRTGDKVVVERVCSEDLRRGDIIVYQSGGRFVCHRLIRKLNRGSGFLLFSRGDASWSCPDTVTGDMLVGRVSAVIKNGKIKSLEGCSRKLLNRAIVIVLPLFARTVHVLEVLCTK